MRFPNKWASWCLSALAAAMVSACVPTSEDHSSAPKPSSSFLRADNAIPHRYIVVMRDDMVGAQSAHLVAEDLAEAYTARVERMFGRSLNGFLAEIDDEEAAMALAEDPMVAFVEQDGLISINADQSDATWGLDRLDQADLPLDGNYIVDGNDGAGVHIYIVDTGVRASHTEFEGRIGDGFDAVDNDADPTDCNGHGTHVAGTAAGSVYGVAKAATIHGVRVLDCRGSGSTSGVIAGVDWVTENFESPAVANMSLGGGVSTALDEAVQRSIEAGVTYTLAAGNSNRDACDISPARTPQALTVGSMTRDDDRLSSSNFGPCVDLFAPGHQITSAWYENDTQTRSISGTSMAAPHVAGGAALYLGENPDARPDEVHDALVSGGVTGRIGNPGSGSPNVLLNVAFLGGSEPPAPPPPSKEGEFDYTANVTWDARIGTTNRSIELSAGQTLTVSTCDSHTGDTYLRLFSGGSQVASNDDACGSAAAITYTAEEDGSYEIRAGCYRFSRCGGTVEWTIE